MSSHSARPCCDIPRVFDGITDMRMHLQDYHSTCLICSSEDAILKFDTVAVLLSHMELHHHACIFQCGAPAFANVNALRQHYVTGHFGCSYCPIRSFRDTRDRSDHYENQHHSLRGENSYSDLKPNAPFPCEDCNNIAGFSHREELDSHMRRSHGVISCADHKCAQSTRILWQPAQRAHMERCHHPNPCNDFDTATAKYCYMCNFPFWTPDTVLAHYRNCHPCRECEGYIRYYFKVKNDHVSQRHGEGPCKPQAFERPHWKTTPTTPPGPADIYTILRIHPQCSDEEAKRAARQRRIETHPDKLKREGMSKAETDVIDEIAKLVGFAADIVSDSIKRREYDEEVSKWRIKHGMY